jgi:hypothetical protein
VLARRGMLRLGRGSNLHRRWRGRSRRRWSGRGCARREQSKRVHVPLRIASDTNTQVDVRDRVLGRPARSDRADRRPLSNDITLADGVAAELNERYRIAVTGLYRDDLPVRAHGPGEGDETRRRGEHGCALIAGDVDSAVLAARVRVAAVDKGPDHVSRGGPRPRVRAGRQCGHDERGCDCCEAAHRSSPC